MNLNFYLIEYLLINYLKKAFLTDAHFIYI